MHVRALIAVLLVLACAAGSGNARQARPAFTAAWSADLGEIGVHGISLDVPVGTVGGRPLVALPSTRPAAIRVHDAETGAILRTFPLARPYHPLDDHMGFVGELLAVSISEGAAERVTVVDPVTGRTRWTRLLPSADAPILDYLTRTAITPTGIVWASGAGLHGLDPASGRDMWAAPWPDGCPHFRLLESEVAVLVQDCRGRSPALHGVDPRAGRLTWTRRIRDSGEELVQIKVSSTRLIIAREPGHVTVLDADGRLVARSPITFPEVGGPTVIHDAELTLLVRSVNGRRETTATRTRDGRVLWRRSLRPRTSPGTAEGYLGNADHLTATHAMGATTTELTPRMIEVVSRADGARDVLPLPVSERASRIVGSTSRDLLVFEKHPGGDRVTAYTFRDGRGASSPLAVPPERWPDACALLDPAVLPGYMPVPGTVEHLGVRWPKPNVCEFLPPDDAGAVVRVAVSWVAATDADATRLARTTLAADPDAQRLGEGAYLRSSTGNDDLRTFAWVTGGRALVDVRAAGDPALTRRAALAVASCLNAVGPGRAGCPPGRPSR
ncbi:PQQ-binding-like beta-propeller repeat protein [Nonomuraea sp. NPDC049725]|uniref:outer membrane protein assembly factor BamB family protein n=1 Tax=Nonomuraea sp. NPDC049725 TaxID=3154508 RepID=UPI003427A1F7